MSSNIWIPKRLFEQTFATMRKNAKVDSPTPALKLNPKAVLCDVNTVRGEQPADLQQLLGSDRVLVNASHTSSPDYFTCLLRYRTNGELPLPPGSSEACDNISDTILCDVPYIPLNAVGGILDKKQLCADRAKHSSPYWVEVAQLRNNTFVPRDSTVCTFREVPTKLATGEDFLGREAILANGTNWLNVEDLTNPGYFTPLNCQQYAAHSIWGGMFTRSMNRAMCRKALHHGYTNRLWVTLDVAERFGAVLNPLFKAHDPPIVSASLTRTKPVVYYCASQFTEPSVFPTKLELQLASAGINIGDKKLGAFDVFKGKSAEERRAHCSSYDEFNPFTSYNEMSRVGKRLVPLLRQWAILRGFSSQTFVSHFEIQRHQLTVAPGCEGIAYNGGVESLRNSVYFNADQFVEPARVESIVHKHPMHFLTRKRFFGPLAEEMVQHQVETKRTEFWWIPVDFLQSAGMTHRPEAKIIVHETAEAFVMGSSDRLPPNYLRPSTNLVTSFVHCEDVVPHPMLRPMLFYVPRNSFGVPYRGKLRGMLILQALQQNYLHEATWLTEDFVIKSGIALASYQDQHKAKLSLAGDTSVTPLDSDDEKMWHAQSEHTFVNLSIFSLQDRQKLQSVIAALRQERYIFKNVSGKGKTTVKRGFVDQELGGVPSSVDVVLPSAERSPLLTEDQLCNPFVPTGADHATFLERQNNLERSSAMEPQVPMGSISFGF